MKNKKSRLLVLNYPFVLAFKKKGLDRYSLIGGTIEVGESPEQTLIRETKEEAGISINTKDFEFIKKAKNSKGKITHERNYYLLNSNKWNFKVMEPEKFDSIEWIDFNDNKEKLKKSDRKIIKKIFKKVL